MFDAVYEDISNAVSLIFSLPIVIFKNLPKSYKLHWYIQFLLPISDTLKLIFKLIHEMQLLFRIL